MDGSQLFAAATQLLILLFAISIHEAAHGWASLRCGDPSAAEAGRLSLSPLRHLDPVGSLLVPVMLLIGGLPLFGWGRPVPLDSGRWKSPQRDDILVHGAGPAANFLGFVLATLALAVALRLVPEGRPAAEAALLPRGEASLELSHFPLMFTLVQLAFLNAFLTIFNLLPIPPLDGGQILLQLMPADWAAKYAHLRPFGLTIVLGLALVQALTLLVLPIYLFLMLVISW